MAAPPQPGGADDSLSLSRLLSFRLARDEVTLVRHKACLQLGPVKRLDNHVTCAHVDARLGRVYLGQQQGAVSFWKQHLPHEPRRVLGHHDGAVTCILSGAGGEDEGEGEGEVDGGPGPAAQQQRRGAAGPGVGSPAQPPPQQQQQQQQQAEAEAEAADDKERAFAPLAGLVATGGVDATIRVWTYNPNGNGPASRCLQTLYGHTRAVTALAVWDGGLASGGADGSVRLWRYQQPQQRRHVALGSEGRFQHVVRGAARGLPARGGGGGIPLDAAGRCRAAGG
jgi:hypothetical protein